MDDHGFEVIDVHQHFDTALGVGEALAVGSGRAAGEYAAAVELDTRLRSMDDLHVSGAVIIAGHSYLRPRGLADTMAVNDAVAAYRDAHPDRFVAAVGIVEPMYGDAAFAEVLRCRDELGLSGISFHNGMQGVPVDSPPMHRLIEKIGEAGLVPFVHALGHELENLWQVDAVARDFPDLEMVVLDVFMSIGQVRGLVDVAERRPNLYFDLALAVSFDFMCLAQVRAAGAERFLYGTDMYSAPVMSKPFGNLLEEILAADLSDAEKSQIFSGNIKRILGLEHS